MYTIGTIQNNKYPIWNNKGEIIAECLNYQDAKLIVESLNLCNNLKKYFK